MDGKRGAGAVSYTHLAVYKRQTNSPPGEGLLFFENVILPFADKFPRDTELYRIISTKPSEVNGV